MQTISDSKALQTISDSNLKSSSTQLFGGTTVVKKGHQHQSSPTNSTLPCVSQIFVSSGALSNTNALLPTEAPLPKSADGIPIRREVIDSLSKKFEGQSKANLPESSSFKDKKLVFDVASDTGPVIVGKLNKDRFILFENK